MYFLPYSEQADGYEEEQEAELFVSLVQSVDQGLEASKVSHELENSHYSHDTNLSKMEHCHFLAVIPLFLTKRMIFPEHFHCCKNFVSFGL